jgi:hypothetical protein
VPDLEHSPLGGSSAERWMSCPGSNVILKKLALPESDAPDYRTDGVAAHEAAAHCLQNGLDTWEIVGQTFHGVEVSPVMADAVQVYLDDCREFMADDVTVYIERKIGEDPEKRPHPAFYGTVDFAAYGKDELIVEDFKYGEGIVVEPYWNTQLLYYAYGVLSSRSMVRSGRVVRLRICQPRAFHSEGPIREWSTTAGEIMHWGETELIPAMQRAEIDSELNPGKWCRFCPAKLFCPQLDALFGAAAKADPRVIPHFGQERMAREFGEVEAVKFYLKALEDEVYRRNSIGNTVPGTKLVQKKSRRIFNAGSEPLFEQRFGVEAFEPKTLKSPAEMEKIGPDAKKLVREHSHMPMTGVTVALDNDPREAVIVPKSTDAFAHLIDQPTEN